MGGLDSFSAGLASTKMASLIDLAIGAGCFLECVSSPPCNLSTSSRIDWASSQYGGLRVVSGFQEGETRSHKVH